MVAEGAAEVAAAAGQAAVDAAKTVATAVGNTVRDVAPGVADGAVTVAQVGGGVLHGDGRGQACACGRGTADLTCRRCLPQAEAA